MTGTLDIAIRNKGENMTLRDDVAAIAKARSSTPMDDGENDPSLDNSLDTNQDDWPDPESAKNAPEPFKDKDQRNTELDLEKIKKTDNNDEDEKEDEYDFDEEDFEEDSGNEPDEESPKEKETDNGDGSDENIPATNDSDKQAETAAIDEATIARAISLGLPASDIEAYSKMGNLSVILDNVEQQKASSSEEKIETEEFKIDLELDPEVFDEDFTNNLNNQVNEKITPIIKGLQDKITSLAATQQQAQHEAFEREFDTVVSHLGESYDSLLGKEAGRVLKSDSTEMKNRGLVLQQVVTLAKNKTDKNWTLSDLVKEALPMVFPEHQEKVAAEKIQRSLKKRSNQTINRPADRNIRRSPKSKAINEVASKMTELGLNPSGVNDFEDEDEF